MKKSGELLKILKDQADADALDIPDKLIERIFKIEEMVQFDGKRVEAPHKIAKAVEAELDKAYLEESTDGNDS